jgi:hypothetical protein
LKKAILIVAALVLVLSGVAAVSAYEGHLINIKAHVENAIAVETYEMDFGAVFPQEELQKQLTFGMSESFCDKTQTRLSSISYELYYELKPLEGDAGPPYMNDYFQPLSPFLVLADGDPADQNDEFLPQPVPVPAPDQPVLVGRGQLTKVIPEPPDGKEGDICDVIHIDFNVPVFEGWYNELTDPKAPWPYMLKKGEFVIEDERLCNTYDVKVPHADLGIDLKIQVVGFRVHVP